MSELTKPEKAFDDKRPVGRLGVRHLSEKEIINQLWSWGRWVGNDDREILRATGSSKHPIQAMIDKKKQEDSGVTHSRAISSSYDDKIMERLDALIQEGRVRQKRHRRPGSLRFVHAQIIVVEFSSGLKQKSQRARLVIKREGGHISREYYSSQLPKAVDHLLQMYNSPDIFIA